MKANVKYVLRLEAPEYSKLFKSHVTKSKNNTSKGFPLL